MNIWTYTYIHTYMHACMHIYIYIYICYTCHVLYMYEFCIRFLLIPRLNTIEPSITQISYIELHEVPVHTHKHTRPLKKIELLLNTYAYNFKISTCVFLIFSLCPSRYRLPRWPRCVTPVAPKFYVWITFPPVQGQSPRAGLLEVPSPVVNSSSRLPTCQFPSWMSHLLW